MPSAASTTAALNSTAPRISDWTWPAPSPWTQATKKRVQTTVATAPTSDAARHEDAQRLVHRVDAEDREAVAAHVGPHRREQPRLARLGVRPDRDVVDRDGHLARLDDRLERVGELRDDLQGERGLAVVGAEARRRVRHVGLRRLAHDPGAEALQRLLQRREVLDRHDLAVADDHVGVAGDDRRDELRDVRAVVLVVGVGVDDHVGAELERGVQTGLEAVGEALVVGQPDDVVDAVGARHLDGAVGRPVVDDEPLDGVEAGQLARQVGERGGEGLLLVEAGNLDDQLHADGPITVPRASDFMARMEGSTLTRPTPGHRFRAR